MNTLRVKIIVLLIAAITIVLVLATSITAVVLGAEKQKTLVLDNIASQIRIVTTLLAQTPANEASGKGPSVPDYARQSALIDARSTDLLNAALGGRMGDAASAHIDVLRQPGKFTELVSISMPNGRVTTVPIPPIAIPSSSILALVSWMGFVLAGTIIVAVIAANWVIRPLALLQSTVSAVDENGMLPRIPEEGPTEVRATAAAINHLSANLRNAMESRMRLVAAAGHDFRTPMTRMRLRAEFMADAAERQRWLRDISELDRIADSAIGLVREEVSKASGEPVKLHMLIASVVEELHDLGCAILCGRLDPISIKGGPLALTRAFRNLLINAATHGKEASVMVSEHGDNASVLIEDRGPGIPEELLGRVFEPFFRVDFARQQATPGAGLGLAIAKEIIHRYGGSLVLRNRVSGGLSQLVTFRTLPISMT